MADLLARLTATGAFRTALVGSAVVGALACIARLRAKGRVLRLWPLGLVLTAAFTAALTVAASVFYAGWDLLGAQGLEHEAKFTSKTLFELVKLSFGVVAGAGALVALVVAYRRQRVTEEDALREATRLHTERFTTATSQLGEESAAVRLGGVHALAGLADDAPTPALRQTCIDVLCAYLRLPYTAEEDLQDGSERREYMALREVRHTVIRLIRDHLRIPAVQPHTWQGYNLDVTGVVFGDFSRAVFSGTVTFSAAVFSGTVNFQDAVFPRGPVEVHGPIYSGGQVVSAAEVFARGGQVSFNGAVFSDGQVSFDGAKFSGGQVNFGGAVFSGGQVSFDNAEFSGGQVNFRSAAFSGGGLDFHGAEFSGGQVDFHGAAFAGGGLDFRRANGPAPRGLVPALRSRPEHVAVPDRWLVAEPDAGLPDPT